MANKTGKTLWGIHGGAHGEVDTLFLNHGVIALGWAEMGDMSKLPSDRDVFKARLLEVLPGRKPGYYPNAGGQLYRFVHELKAGDLVIFPSKLDRRIHVGEITGTYQYFPKSDSAYPQHRTVKWIKSFPRTQLSQGALYEIGSAMSFFQVKNYAEEFLSALAGKKTTSPVKQDESVSYVSADIEQNTRDFVLKTLAQELKGHALADFVAHLLGTMGYRTRVAPPGPDGGVDIVAHKDELGFEPPVIKVQVKSTEGKVGDEILSQLIGKLGVGEYGMLVTLGVFTNQALGTARNKSNLRLVDGNGLVDLILKYYEQFGSKYKGFLPLKSVYVPESLENADA